MKCATILWWYRMGSQSNAFNSIIRDVCTVVTIIIIESFNCLRPREYKLTRAYVSISFPKEREKIN